MAAEKSLYPLYAFLLVLNLLLACVIAALMYQAIFIITHNVRSNTLAHTPHNTPRQSMQAGSDACVAVWLCLCCVCLWLVAA